MSNGYLKKWEIIDRSLIADASPWLKLFKETIKINDGLVVDDYYTIDQPDYSAVFASVNEDSILGIWHYKHGSKDINLGLPAGYVQTNETPLAAGKRELLEETGYIALEWEHLGTFSVDGNRGCGNAHVYFATDLSFETNPNPDDLEEMKIEIITIKDMYDYLLKNKVTTLGAAVAITLGLLKLQNQMITMKD
jgi:ADP-ribose pyrophosphatase